MTTYISNRFSSRIRQALGWAATILITILFTGVAFAAIHFYVPPPICIAAFFLGMFMTVAGAGCAQYLARATVPSGRDTGRVRIALNVMWSGAFLMLFSLSGIITPHFAHAW